MQLRAGGQRSVSQRGRPFTCQYTVVTATRATVAFEQKINSIKGDIIYGGDLGEDLSLIGLTNQQVLRRKWAGQPLIGAFCRWVGYEQENFRGRQYLWDMSERGEYNCYDKWCAQVDHVSSVRAVKQVSLSQPNHPHGGDGDLLTSRWRNAGV